MQKKKIVETYEAQSAHIREWIAAIVELLNQANETQLDLIHRFAKGLLQK